MENNNGAPVPDVEISSIGLFSMTLKRDVELDKRPNELSYGIRIEIKRSIAPEIFHVSFVDTAIYCYHDSTIGSHLSTTYMYTIKCNTAQIISDDIHLNIAKYVIWQRNQEMFAHVISSTDLQFPRLPAVPPSGILFSEFAEIATDA